MNKKDWIEKGRDKPHYGSEDGLQMTIANYLLSYHPDLLWFHVPNGGKRNQLEAKKFKRMGVRAGVSDLIFLEPRKGYNGLIIELKSAIKRMNKGKIVTAKGRLTDSQKNFLSMSNDRNYKTFVAWSFDAVKEILDEYFK